MGLGIFLRDSNDFSTKTECGIVLEYFYEISVGLEIFLSEDKREEKLDLEIFCPKRRKGKRELD